MSASRTDLEREVEQLILAVLRPKAPLTAPLTRDGTEAWDSLKHVEIVFALEDRYGVQFDESEFALMDSAAAIAGLLLPRLEA